MAQDAECGATGQVGKGAPEGGCAGDPSNTAGRSEGRASRGAGAVSAPLAAWAQLAASALLLPAVPRWANSMRTKQVNLLIALVAVMLFSFSCFCISKMSQTSKRRRVLQSFSSWLPAGLRGCCGSRAGDEAATQDPGAVAPSPVRRFTDAAPTPLSRPLGCNVCP